MKEIIEFFVGVATFITDINKNWFEKITQLPLQDQIDLLRSVLLTVK